MDNQYVDLKEIVTEAGEILKGYFKSQKFTSKSKGGVDFLTQADEEVDLFLREAIKKKYPQTQFLTEETAPSDYLSLKETENLWVIDPLDGTVNFSRKNPHFAISISLVNKGVSKFAIVYVPMSGELYWAQEDKDNAYLNGESIQVSKTHDLKETTLGCDWGWDLEKRLNVVDWLKNICTHVRQIKSMGSAVADLASLAEGKIDVYLCSGLKPWDVAASSLLIRKAGGKITTPTGGEWDIFNPDILASNGILHREILDLVI